MEDTGSNVPGSFMTAKTIWDMAVIPALMNSAECWFDVPKEALDKLFKLECTFYQAILNSPVTCPKPGLFWFTGGILPRNKIIEKKLLFLKHIVQLNKQTLASEVLNVQRELELPGLWSESLDFFRELDISLDDLFSTSKQQFKTLVRQALVSKNRDDLLRMIEPYKKLNIIDLTNEEFETKKYMYEMSLSQVRTKFAIDTNMLRTVKSLFPSDQKFSDDLWRCDQCSRIDSIRHLTRCPYFSELRENKNLQSNEEDLVTYFQEVVQIRMEYEQDQLS